MENRITDALNKLKNKKEFFDQNYINLYPAGSRAGILYCLAKIHKPIIDDVPLCHISYFYFVHALTNKCFSG